MPPTPTLGELEPTTPNRKRASYYALRADTAGAEPVTRNAPPSSARLKAFPPSPLPPRRRICSDLAHPTATISLPPTRTSPSCDASSLPHIWLTPSTIELVVAGGATPPKPSATYLFLSASWSHSSWSSRCSRRVLAIQGWYRAPTRLRAAIHIELCHRLCG